MSVAGGDEPVPLTPAAWERYRRTGSPDEGGVAPVSREGDTGATRTLEDVPRVSVLTPTRPGREELLAEAADSVRAQTEEVAHLIWLDADREGPAAARNKLLSLAQSEYVAFLDDDDLLDPEHIASLMALIEGSACDLVWSRCRVWAAPGVWAPRIPQPLRPDYSVLVRGGRNFIPVTVVARLASVRAAGGFNPADRYEDYELFRRMLGLGQAFGYLPVETWTYRFFGDSRTVTG